MGEEQTNYTAPTQPTNTKPNEDTTPLTLGQYLVMFILMVIPIVNIIMPFVWGFGSDNVNKKNFGKASLIMILIKIVLWLIFGASFIAMLAGIMSQF